MAPFILVEKLTEKIIDELNATIERQIKETKDDD